jgi:Mg-chelatase subunit ChlD
MIEAESRREATEATPGTRTGDAATAPRNGTHAPAPTKAEQLSKTPGSTVPSGQDPEREQAAGGNAGESVGATESKGEAAPRADGATRAESARPAEAPAADARDTGTPTGDGNRGGPAKIGDLNSIELPELEIETLEADQSALLRAGNTRTIDAHPLAGVWEQVEGPNTADFGPGGYDRSIVMLNPGTRIAAVYRVFRGSIAIVMGGELALDLGQDDGVKREGTAELRIDPSLPSRFPPSRLPLGGNPARFAEPPVPGNPWRLEWRRDQLQLVLGDKRYAPSTVEAFESIRRGGGDVATPDEASERAPTRPAVTAGAGPKPKEAAFFGVRGGGKRFVFIVDVSGSMLGAKLDRLKDELTKSVRALERDAEFSIVFFAGDAQVIDQSWMTASSDRDRAIQLIARQGCSGGTDPTKAFDFAFKTLSPIPDCVFFMTDGQIPPWIPDHVRGLNAARIPSEIHTIVVGSPTEEPAMRPHMERIASENHGTYTFVPQ